MSPQSLKNVARTFPGEKRVLAFHGAASLCFHTLVCLLRLRHVTMYPHLITGDNVSQEIIPLYSTSCRVFRTLQDGLLSDLPSRGEESNLPILFGIPNYLKWLIGHSHTISQHVQQFSMLSTSIISRIARIFISLVFVHLHRLWAIGIFWC